MGRFALLRTHLAVESRKLAVDLVWIEGASTVEEALEKNAVPHVRSFMLAMN